METKVSVLITFYNNEEYVDQALSSVFNQQTNFLYKVIIGDDGSTDRTIELINQWKEKYNDRIELIVQERKTSVKYVRGARASRNRLELLKRVDTPYFIYLDGDDYWTDNTKLQQQFDILEKQDNKDCVCCGHNIREYYEGDSIESQILPGPGMKEGKYDIKKYWRKYYVHTDTILFRSDYIKDIPEDIVLDDFNDNTITFCFMQFGSMYFQKKCMADYRQNDGSLWANEKNDVNLIREFISYDLVNMINPDLRKTTNMRYIGVIFAFFINHKLFQNVDDIYLEMAKRHSCETTIRVLEKNHLFSSSWLLDGFRVGKLIFARLLFKVSDAFKDRLQL